MNNLAFWASLRPGYYSQMDLHRIVNADFKYEYDRDRALDAWTDQEVKRAFRPIRWKIRWERLRWTVWKKLAALAS